MLSSQRGATHIVRHENITNQISSRFMTQTAKLFPVKLHLQMLFLCTVLPYWRHIDNFWGPCRLMLRLKADKHFGEQRSMSWKWITHEFLENSREDHNERSYNENIKLEFCRWGLSLSKRFSPDPKQINKVTYLVFPGQLWRAWSQ